jgi:hypothetical protein
MNDVTYLNDEAIEKLEQIKIYQDLRENSGAYDALDEETKKLEDEKFTNNDRIAKVEIRVYYTLKSVIKPKYPIHDDNL